MMLWAYAAAAAGFGWVFGSLPFGLVAAAVVVAFLASRKGAGGKA